MFCCGPSMDIIAFSPGDKSLIECQKLCQLAIALLIHVNKAVDAFWEFCCESACGISLAHKAVVIVASAVIIYGDVSNSLFCTPVQGCYGYFLACLLLLAAKKSFGQCRNVRACCICAQTLIKPSCAFPLLVAA